MYKVHIFKICTLPPPTPVCFSYRENSFVDYKNKCQNLCDKYFPEFLKNIFSLRSQKYLTYSSNNIILLYVVNRFFLLRGVENMFIDIY